MSFRKMFETDSQVEQEGIWLDYGDGKKIRVARAGGANERYRTALQRVFAQHKRKLQLDVLSIKQQNDLVLEVFADTVVLEWEGVTQDDLLGNGSDEPVGYSKGNAIALFTALPELYRDVQEQAQSAAAFKTHLDELTAKN